MDPDQGQDKENASQPLGTQNTASSFGPTPSGKSGQQHDTASQSLTQPAAGDGEPLSQASVTLTQPSALPQEEEEEEEQGREMAVDDGAAAARMPRAPTSDLPIPPSSPAPFLHSGALMSGTCVRAVLVWGGGVGAGRCLGRGRGSAPAPRPLGTSGYLHRDPRGI